MAYAEDGPRPYAPTIEELPTVSSGHARAFLRQAVGISFLFWIVALVGATVATLRGTDDFLHYLKFSAIAAFGLVLLGGSTIGSRITTMGADKWGLGYGRYGYEQDYGDSGLMGMGIVFVLAPQIGLIAYLID